MPSFDFSSKVDLQTLDNAINTVNKEITNRFDFKGSHVVIELNKKDFKINLEADSEMKKSVPLHFVGAEVSPAVKLSASIISHVATKLTVACLPSKLPEFITVDLSKMEAGTSLHAKDIVMPAGVRAVIKAKSNPVVASASAVVAADRKSVV